MTAHRVLRAEEVAKRAFTTRRVKWDLRRLQTEACRNVVQYIESNLNNIYTLCKKKVYRVYKSPSTLQQIIRERDREREQQRTISYI